jgi:hypothetical protein
VAETEDDVDREMEIVEAAGDKENGCFRYSLQN